MRIEKVGDDYYREGTVAKVQNAGLDILHKGDDVLMRRLNGQVDRAFDGMVANVDSYLDWYYSLVGEYARIGKMLVGELEGYMANNLFKSLQKGDVFREFESEFNKALAAQEHTMGDYQEERENIMSRNRIDPTGSPFHVVNRMSLEKLLNPLIHQNLKGLQKRLSLSGGATAITAAVASKVVAKTVGKSVIKLASKALFKVVVSKAVATGSGAVAGSIVPGIGTTVGAIVGGTLGGIAVGISVETLLLKLEELLSREEFKRQLVSVIREAQVEFKAKLKGGKSGGVEGRHREVTTGAN